MSKQPTRITYLFGAGASIGESKNWLNNIPERAIYYSHLDSLRSGIPITNDLNSFRKIFSEIVGREYTEWQHESKDSFLTGDGLELLFAKRLKRAFTSQLSPDTFGRMLRISERFDKYEEFKIQLGLFISLLDSLTYPDNRYANLLSNFIEIDSGLVSENINFLTYNFDFSPEKSYYNFVKSSEIENASLKWLRSNYGIAHSGKSVNKINPSGKSIWLKLHGSSADFKLNSEEFSILKTGKPDFNDSFALFPPDPNRYTEIASEDDSVKRKIHSFDALGQLHGAEVSPIKGASSTIRFAWDIDKHLLKAALDKLENTQILVVVGYTFPAFNQQNDLLLLKALMDSRFERLIIQLPPGEGEIVKRRVVQMFVNLGASEKVIEEKKVEIIDDITAFHIPVEYFGGLKDLYNYGTT